jgi:hypothetical protein
MTFRFGPFEVDTDFAELRKYGVRVALQEQPFRRYLRPCWNGRVSRLARRNMISRLWAGGTHVDFDRGLNAAVTGLRQTLSGSAESPRYVDSPGSNRRSDMKLYRVAVSGGEPQRLLDGDGGAVSDRGSPFPRIERFCWQALFEPAPICTSSIISAEPPSA